MKWLITGSEGFIGSHLCQHLFQRHEVLGTYLEKPRGAVFNSFPLDVLNRSDIRKVFEGFTPQCVVHLAGSKDVQWCERNPQEAYKLNTESVRYVAEACQEFSCGLIFLSSDYVFEGTKGRYSLESVCNPQTVYGKTKLEAENILKGMSIPFSIIRTGGVYAGVNPPQSLLGFALNSLQKKQEVNAFDNIFNTPTFIGDLCKAIEILGQKQMTGHFHLGGASRESRYSFLRLFAQAFGFPEELIKRGQFKQEKGFLRPRDISLDSSSAYQAIGFLFHGAADGLRLAYRQRNPSKGIS